MSTILLNWLPPSTENNASPAISVLKAYLQQNNYNVHVKYWNLAFNTLMKDFFNMGNKINEKDSYKFLPFISYLSIHFKDEKLKEKIKYHILSLKPYLNNRSNNYIDNYLLDYYKKINFVIDKEITEMPINKYLYMGFSTQFNQWVIANIIIDRIRKIFPDTLFLAGGCGTKKEAEALLRNFPHIHYAMWGEGEYSLLQLTRYIENLSSEQIILEDIPNIAYRQNELITASNKPNIYVDLDKSLYDYTDYFQQIEQYSVKTKPKIPIEKGRGCHWKRCRFCFLNSGYKFRYKTNETIIKEIKASINQYGVMQFFFLDNDIIGNNIENFNNLLDTLIELRSEYNKFEILMAEIVTKDITSSVIKKMALAGFRKIQIGYESPSTNLLSKINKKNTFASNILCIKWCLYYGIKLGGVNVLRNLLEEADEDIKESIKNLFYLRFYLEKEIFYHNMSFLSVAESSRYYNMLTEEQKHTYDSGFWNFLPYNYIEKQDKFKLIMDFVVPEYNNLWDLFEKIEAHYLQNKYSYKLIHNDGIIYYNESYNFEETKVLSFDKQTSLHWAILEQCNHKVQSLSKLQNIKIIQQLSQFESLLDAIVSLKEEGLLYCNNNKSEIVGIINTDSFTA